MEHVAFVGPGRLGLALGYALHQADETLALTYHGRRPEPPAHPLFVQGMARWVFGLEPLVPGTTAVFLTVPDAALPEMAHALAAQGEAPAGCAAFHCSPSLPTDVLAPLHARGYAVGSLHPFQVVTHPVSGAERLHGSVFAVTGGREASAVARRVVGLLGGREVTVAESRRPLYHAAAVAASGHLAALVTAAARLLVQAGVPEDEALRAVVPLARGTLDDLEALGAGATLGGSGAGGDAETVELHLRALEPRERAIYAALGREMVELGEAFGLADDEAARLREALETEEARTG